MSKLKRFAASALFTLVAAMLLSLSACEGKMQKMSNQELSQKRAECIRQNPTSPGRVTACENIRKECEARRAKGNYAC
ncbi:hypothetical protein [Agaribacterium haliotis]|uniref:hypothetical protein n=1 Tax=Agaribacterium haliotis TaxID=2013869 RepID=UPI000BB56486|nr:hypothetical protein [Agaribacterium haliotis]